MVRARLRLLGAMTLAAFSVIVVRLFYLQVVVPDELGELNLYESAILEVLPPYRGQILDAHGRLLAGNETRYDVYFKLGALHPREVYLAEFQRAFWLCREEPYPGRDDMCTCVDLERSLSDMARSFEEVRRLRQRLQESGGSLPPRPFLKVHRRGDVGRLPPKLRRVLGERGFEFRPDAGGGATLHAPLEELLGRELTLLRVHELGGGPYLELLERVDAVAAGLRQRMQSDRPLNQTERSYFRSQTRLLCRDAPRELVTAILYHPDRFTGLSVEPRTRRVYPWGESAGIVTGYLASVGDERRRELAAEGLLLTENEPDRKAAYESFRQRRRRGRQEDELVGIRGLESAYQDRLRGLPGLRLDIESFRGRREPLEPPIPPEHGKPLHTTLDAQLQHELHAELSRQVQYGYNGIAASAAVVRLRGEDDSGGDGDPPGAILAMATAPSFDPQRLMEDSGYIEELAADSRRGPLLSRPYKAFLNPGSVFKIVVALAAMEDGVDVHADLEPGEPYPRRPLDPRTRFACRHVFDEKRLGDRFHCSSSTQHNRSDPRLTLVEALKYSCNTYVYELGKRRLLPHTLHDWGLKLGLGRPTFIDLDTPRERQLLVRGDAPRAGALRRRLPRRYPPILHYTIGQGFVTASPLQVLRAVSAVALGDRVPWPYLVDSQPAEPIEIAPRSLAALRQGLRAAAQERGGTAHKGVLEAFDFAAKTGTAQISADGKLYHSWMAGYAPAENPRIAFVVRVEKTPLGGGDATASIVRTILDHFARRHPQRYRKGVSEHVSGPPPPPAAGEPPGEGRP